MRTGIRLIIKEIKNNEPTTQAMMNMPPYRAGTSHSQSVIQD